MGKRSPSPSASEGNSPSAPNQTINTSHADGFSQPQHAPESPRCSHREQISSGQYAEYGGPPYVYRYDQAEVRITFGGRLPPLIAYTYMDANGLRDSHMGRGSSLQSMSTGLDRSMSQPPAQSSPDHPRAAAASPQGHPCETPVAHRERAPPDAQD